MMRLWFELAEPRPRDDARGWFEAMATALSGRKVSLERREHWPTDDRNGLNHCFTARWSDGDITWEQELTHTDGNPRDGWGYALRLELEVGSVTVRASHHEGPFRSVSLDVDGTARDWLTVRATLRRELGEAADRCHLSYVAYELLPRLTAEGEHAAALALARESLAGSKQSESMREEIVAWLAANDPASAGPQMQVKEAPGALAGWLALERAGTPGLTEVFARLCPYELTRWRAAGLPPAPWFAHPAWPFERDDSAPSDWQTLHLTADHVSRAFLNELTAALTGWQENVDWQEVDGDWEDGRDGWRWSASRRARVPEGGHLPVVRATLSGARREPHEWKLDSERLMSLSLRETLTWTWIGGPTTGDAVVVVEHELPRRPNGTPEPSGFALTIVGTPEFRERARQAVRAQFPFRWHPVEARDSLKPWAPQTTTFPDVLTALEALVTPQRLARARELLTCRCPQPIGYCAHRRELLGYSRESSLMGPPAEQALLAAWDAAFHSVGAQPRLESVERNLRDAWAAHVRAQEWVER